MKRLITTIALLGAMLLVGCDGGVASNPQPSTTTANSENVQMHTPAFAVDHGNGVYYFDTEHPRNFKVELPKFMDEHPELELVTMTSDVRGVYGRGYFVYFREKGPCICDDLGPQDDPEYEPVRQDSR